MRDLQLRYNPGMVLISLPIVMCYNYGPNGVERAIMVYDTLKQPNWGWNDQTGNLRASVKRIAPTVVAMGGSDTFYAVYVEALKSPMRTAWQLALNAYGFSDRFPGELQEAA